LIMFRGRKKKNKYYKNKQIRIHTILSFLKGRVFKRVLMAFCLFMRRKSYSLFHFLDFTFILSYLCQTSFRWGK
jgi:uncharacterized metal-binding protein